MKDIEKKREKAKFASREWRKNNPELSKQKARDWRSKNKERHRNATKEWRLKNPEKVRQMFRNWKIKNKEKVRDYQKEYLKSPDQRKKATARTARWRKNNPAHGVRKYGITPEQYNQMFVDQNGKCRICGNGTEVLRGRLVVDHDHITGKVRGLLCNSCNLFLGNAKDNCENLQKGIEYLKRHKGI